MGKPVNYDVFLSHSSRNKPWVEALARNLSSAGFRVFLDVWDLVPGQFLADSLHEALQRSRSAVLGNL